MVTRSLLFLLLAGYAAAALAEPGVAAVVSRTTVRVNQPFVITVQVTDGTPEDITIPDVDGLVIDKDSPSQSTSYSMRIEGGQVSRTEVHRLDYQAVATQGGPVRIPAITVRVNGKTMKTTSLVLTAVEGTGRSQPFQASAAPSGGEPLGGARPSSQVPRRSITWEEAGFVETAVDKTEVYQGEQVRLTLSVWEAAPYAAVMVGDFPTTEGFYAVPQAPEKTTEERVSRDGIVYHVTRLAQTLYPTRVGEAVIGPWQGWAGEDSFFGFQRKALVTTPAIHVTVKSLPPRPPNFSGAVGAFSLDAHLERKELLQGVPMKLEVRIVGQGNPDAVGEPQFPGKDGVYVSEPEKETRTIDTATGPGVEKTLVYAITPLTTGDLELPEITYSYFDPSVGEYKTCTASPGAIHVFASGEQRAQTGFDESSTPRPGTIEPVGTDIEPIITDPGDLRPHRPSPFTVPAAGGLPVIGYTGLALFMRRKRRFAGDTALARAHRARKTCHRRLRAVTHTKEPDEALYHAMIEFIADAFDLTPAGITSHDARRLLADHAVDSDLAENVDRILRACERARYASAMLSPAELVALTQAALDSVDRLDATLKKERRQ